MNFVTCRVKKNIRYGLGLIAMILAAASVSSHADGWVRARWVADGDTIVLQDGRHVRYIGIDTPEIDHKNHRSAPMGAAALIDEPSTGRGVAAAAGFMTGKKRPVRQDPGLCVSK
jgi:hypothetical protein